MERLSSKLFNQEDFNELLIKPLPLDSNSFRHNAQKNEGIILSNCLLSALTAVECDKLTLKIGTILDNPLYFNLLSMEFYKADNKIFNLAIIDFLKTGHSKNELPINYEKITNSKKLSESRVLIVGTGGLGSPVAYALACLGIGTIGVVDYDSVEISNLNRQILHSILGLVCQRSNLQKFS